VRFFLIFLVGIIITSLVGISHFDYAFADENTIISVNIIGDPVIYLDSENKMIRAKVVIENFDPSDGYYFMRVSDSSGNVVKDTEIFPKDKANQIWGTEIAHIITNEVPETFQILIYTEFGTATATATVSLLETKPNVQQSVNAYADEFVVSITGGSGVQGCEEDRNCYSPQHLTIGLGDRVIWKNDDTIAHTVTSGSPSDGPDGKFDSSLFMAGETFSFTFDDTGNHRYFCFIHPWMAGSIKVFSEPVNQPSSIPEPTIADDKVVILYTSSGKIVIELFSDDAPKTVKNFLNLADSGFYDGVLFHRIVKDFMIQGGDPLSKDPESQNMWGSGDAGYNIEAEFNTIKHNRGIVSMANSARPDSASSQFFIVHADSNYLDEHYTVFGRIATQESFDTLDKIASLETGARDVPINPEQAKILSAEVIERSKISDSLELGNPERVFSSIPEPTIAEQKEVIGLPEQEPTCLEGYVLKSGVCEIIPTAEEGTDQTIESELISDPEPSEDKQEINTKQGLWAKYGFDVQVQTGDRWYSQIENNDKIIEDFLIQGILSSSIPAQTWRYMNPDDLMFLTFEFPQFSEDVIVINYYATSKDGIEYFVSTETVDTEDFIIDVKNRKVGERIKLAGVYVDVASISKQKFGGKEVDVIIVEQEDISARGSFKTQFIIHKQTGIILSLVIEIIGNEVYYPDDKMRVSYSAVEISDEFVERSSILGGGCLIATATFGSELAPQVQMLREIRDNSLLQTQSGQSFMQGFNQFYYSFSPTIADYERQNPVFKEAVKLAITPLLASLSLLNYVDLDSEESVLGYGIGIILMNIGMYFVAPVIVISKLKK